MNLWYDLASLRVLLSEVIMKKASLETQTIIRPPGTSLPVYVGHYKGFEIPRGGIEAPHRHDFQELLWFVRGEGRNHIDGKTHDIAPGTIAVIARGQVHWLEHAHGLELFRLCFHDEFLPTSDLHARLPIALFSPTRGGEPLRPSTSDWALGLTLFGALVREFGRAATHQDLQVLRALVVAMVKLVERIDHTHPSPSPPANGFVQAFLDLLEEHVSERHEVSFYAAKLVVSPDKLCQDLQQVLGKTTKQVIRERIVLEARRHLIYTDMSIKEVGGSLGFSDPQYFGKIFKESLGITPAAYRRAALTGWRERPEDGVRRER